MKKAFLFVILAGVGWGTSGIFVHYMAPYGFTSMQMTALRGSIALLGLTAYLLIFDRSLFRARLRDLPLLLLGGVSLFLTAFCYFTSMQMTSVFTAVVLMYTSPVLVMIFSVAFLGERLTPLKGVSVGVMLVGCALVAGIVGGLSFHPVGVLIGALSGVSYASYSICTRLLMQRGYHTFTTTFYTFLAVSAVSLALCRPWQMPTLFAAAPAVTVPLAVGLGLVTFVMPYFCYTSALRTMPAGMASALSIVEPLSATLFGFLILKEPLTLPALIGIVLILAAVLLMSRSTDNGGENKAQCDKETDNEKRRA